MEPIAADVDGELLSSSCRLMNTGGTSVAEMVVNTKDAARHLVNMLDGIKVCSVDPTYATRLTLTLPRPTVICSMST